jgi:hypothetical protein
VRNPAQLFLCDRWFVDPSRKFPHPFIRKPFIHRHCFSIYMTAGSFIAMANTVISLNSRSKSGSAAGFDAKFFEHLLDILFHRL